MVIQVTGTNFINKGAEVMLHAIVKEVSTWDEVNAVAADLRIGSFEERNRAGLAHLMVPYSMKFSLMARAFSAGFGLIPEAIRNQINWVAEKDVDLVFDASGFALSDQWGPGMADGLKHKFQEARRKGARIVMLPQAFGPFNHPEVRTAAQDVLNLVDFVFAREQQSLEYLQDLGIPDSKCAVAPDFTNLLKVPKSSGSEESYACVVPNYRMVDMTAKGIEDAYVQFLCESVRKVEKSGLPVRVVLHTTNPHDRNLGEIICSRTDAKLFKPFDAIEVKQIIGESEFVISSRFHGLVNALSQGVPAAATGWSHKYQYLMEEYDCADYLISMQTSLDEQLSRVNQIMNKRESVREHIKDPASLQRMRTHQMWNQVQELAMSITA